MIDVCVYCKLKNAVGEKGVITCRDPLGGLIWIASASIFGLHLRLGCFVLRGFRVCRRKKTTSQSHWNLKPARLKWWVQSSRKIAPTNKINCTAEAASCSYVRSLYMFFPVLQEEPDNAQNLFPKKKIYMYLCMYIRKKKKKNPASSLGS